MINFNCRIAFTALVTIALSGAAFAQDNPYREDGWAKLPDGRRLGQMSAIDVDLAGNVWALDRCGANSCAGSNVTPVVKLDPAGRYLTRFGAGLFVYPHGMHVDKDGKVKMFIPGLGGNPESQSAGEAVAADAMGNVYWIELNGMVIRKFVKK